VCARHGTELVGCKSPRQVFVEPKARRRARAQPRGWVWRKSNPKARGDEQEPDMRCGTLGTSGHVTMKSSIYDRGVLYKSGVYARQSSVSYPGRSPMLPWSVACEANWLGKEKSIPTAWEKSAEGIVAGKRIARDPAG
jgi:hypothetical protein